MVAQRKRPFTERIIPPLNMTKPHGKTKTPRRHRPTNMRASHDKARPTSLGGIQVPFPIC